MINARNALITAVTIAMISILGVVISSMRPPDRGGLGGDTYGTRDRGYRALLETLRESGLPAGRGLIPPSEAAKGKARLVFIGPEDFFVNAEPEYLRTVARWIRQGGHVLIAPALHETDENDHAAANARSKSGGASNMDRIGAALIELGLPYVKLARNKPEKGSSEDKRQLRLTRPRRPAASVPISARGDLAQIQDQGALPRLFIPTGEIQYIDESSTGTLPSGGVWTDGATTPRLVVGLYKLDQGEIAVVSDPAIVENAAIAKEGNAALAAGLLGRGEGPVVFDEFYHGLTVRGNPFWLLTRPPWGLLAGLVVAASLLMAWREGTRLGPALPAPVAGRRALREYVDAMSNLYARRNCARFVLREVRDGALWSLRRHLGLGPGRENAEDLARALRRRDPQAADDLRAAVAEAEEILSAPREPRTQRLIESARRMASWQ